MKNFGVWGLGVVGRSVIRFLHAQGHTISLYDARAITSEEGAFLKSYGVRYYPPDQQEVFLKSHTHIVPSPGIALPKISLGIPSFVHELTLFGPLWHKPLIAVTGSLGKTTLVTLLRTLLEAHNRSVATGGNIGTAMLDLLPLQESVDYGILELSSFQLEYADSFAPNVAIMTNLYANHLDRHGTLNEYFTAKAQIFLHQKSYQQALLPFPLLGKVRELTSRSINYFAIEEPSAQELHLLKEGDILYTLTNDSLIKRTCKDGQLETKAYSVARYSAQGASLLSETWLIILATSDMLGMLDSETFTVPDFSSIEHRIEFVGSFAGKLFYNDSKSTIVEATKAAVTTLSSRPVHLILGGLSKGVNREPGIAQLKPYVASIACFGKEAPSLEAYCKKHQIVSSCHTTLEEALNASVNRAKANDIILLSPAGTSFDLYKDYQERGHHFKKLVKTLYGH
jgi:UDP-N-acetylmuramoylalanine--D-glutamate ligase